MVKMQTLLVVVLMKATTQQLPSLRILQTMSDSKKNTKTTLCMVNKEEVATTFQLILTV